MEAAIFSRTELSHNREDLMGLFEELEKNDMGYTVNETFAPIVEKLTGRELKPEQIYRGEYDFPQRADLAISYGGDGTFLDTVRMLAARPVPILGINYGHLGFLANVAREDVGGALSQVTGGNYTVEERILLDVQGDFGAEVEYPYAFNEFSVQKNTMAMISVEVFIDGEYITTYPGDGLILSTPAGSTAYALSVGGPIVSPNSRCFVIAPIASHNLTMRPLVVPDTSKLVFILKTRAEQGVVTLDNRDYLIPNGATFSIKKSEKPVFLVKLQNISFYQTLRDKMMWGVDARKFSK